MKKLYTKTLLVLSALVAGVLLTGCESDQPHFSKNCLQIDGTVPYTGTGGTATNAMAAARPMN
jgi:hypothetical protein